MNPYAFIDEFRAESTEHLRTLDAQLLILERAPADARPVRTMFLAAHSIKGGAAMLDLAEVRELAHALEDALGSLRDGRRSLDPAAADLLFRAVDRLGSLIADARPGAPAQPASQALVAELAGWSTGSGVTAAAPGGAAAGAAPPGQRVLLVEDSATVRLTETILLEEAGFAVDAVADGLEALRRAESGPYALVVVGTQTSGLDGADLAAALRDASAAEPRPAVLVTAGASGLMGPQGCGDAARAPGTLAERARALIGAGGQWP